MGGDSPSGCRGLDPPDAGAPDVLDAAAVT
jgi:hypothetical protein